MKATGSTPPRVTYVKAKPGYVLALEFSDGSRGEFSLEHWLFEISGQVFEPLKDPKYFAQVTLDEVSSICWPNGADLDPVVLHFKLRLQQAIQDNPDLPPAFVEDVIRGKAEADRGDVEPYVFVHQTRQELLDDLDALGDD